jgi:uncharacterized membrane protein YbhN (UPF0104 family)
VTLTQVAILVGALFGIHFLLPQVGELRASVDTLKSVNLGWTAVAVLASAGTYLAVGFNQCTASAVKVPYLPMVWTQFAASFMNRFTPVSVGTIVLSSRLMVRYGMDRGPALAAAGLPTAVGLITSILLLLVAAPSSASKLAGRIVVPEGARILPLAIVAGLVIGVLALPLLRHRIKTAVGSIWRGLRTQRSPAKAGLLTLGCVVNSSMYVTSLWASLQAFDVALSPLQIFTVYFAGALIGRHLLSRAVSASRRQPWSQDSPSSVSPRPRPSAPYSSSVSPRSGCRCCLEPSPCGGSALSAPSNQADRPGCRGARLLDPASVRMRFQGSPGHRCWPTSGPSVNWCGRLGHADCCCCAVGCLGCAAG